MPTAHFPGVLNTCRLRNNIRRRYLTWELIYENEAQHMTPSPRQSQSLTFGTKRRRSTARNPFSTTSLVMMPNPARGSTCEFWEFLGACHENRILAVGESDDNDTRIANGYNSHSVTSNNGVCTTECTCIISCNPVALVDIFNSMSFQYKQSSIRCVRHSINRRTISNLLCVRARNFWSQARVWHKVKCVSELTLEVSHELIIRIARATPGHRWKKGCFNRSMSIVEEEL